MDAIFQGPNLGEADCDYKISRVTFPTKMRENMRKSRLFVVSFFSKKIQPQI